MWDSLHVIEAVVEAVCVSVHSTSGSTFPYVVSLVHHQKSYSSKIIFTDTKPSPSMCVVGELQIAFEILSYHLW